MGEEEGWRGGGIGGVGVVLGGAEEGGEATKLVVGKVEVGEGEEAEEGEKTLVQGVECGREDAQVGHSQELEAHLVPGEEGR